MTKPTGWLFVSLYSRPSKATLLEAIEQAEECGFEAPKMTNNKERVLWLGKARQKYWDRMADKKPKAQPLPKATISASEVNAFLQTLPPFGEGNE